jgi:simple sugar transport system permease protein
MTAVLEALFSVVFVAQVVRIAMPYLLAALGGVVSERAGVVALGLEGQLLAGAFASVVVTHATHQPLLGVLAGVLAGVALAALLGLCTVRLGGDQIVAGIAINLLAVGGTRYFLKLLFDSSSNSPRIDTFAAPAWARHPLVALLFDPLFLVAVLALVAVHYGLFRTALGLRLRAVGEHPEAADTVGVSVPRVRFFAVLVAGALGGLGGVWLGFDQHQFVDQMSGLRGYIALAAVIFGKWRPLPVALACLLFGFAEALQIALQGAKAPLPTQLVQSIPYLLTMITLAGLIGRSTAPAALGKAYLKE